MTIEEDSIQFLEKQISDNYKEIFDQYLIDNIEWENCADGIRPIAELIDTNNNQISNLIVLFPPFKINK